MCVILSIYQKEKKNKNAIVNTIESLIPSNPDGIGIVSFDNVKQKWTSQRELKIDINDLRQIFQDNNIINVHLRNGTSGKISKHNIHFWRKNDWMFAHNGQITEYSNNNHFTDSYIFFQRLVNLNYLEENGKIHYKKIKKMMNKLSYWGRFVLINTKTNRIYYFGDFHVYLMNKNTLIISTQHIDFNNYYSFYGITFRDKKQTDIMKIKMEGIFYIDINKEKMKKIDDNIVEFEGYGGYENNCSLRQGGDFAGYKPYNPTTI